MNELSPQELSNLWYLKFGYAWIERDTLDKDWREISNKLMQNNLADYEIMMTIDHNAASEIIKLKETCR